MNPDFEQLAELISAVSESLHREMREGFTQINTRFDQIESRLDENIVLLEDWILSLSRWRDQIYER